MKKGLSLLSTLAVAFVMCLGVMWVFSSSAFAAEDPDLIVTYGDKSTPFFYDADQGKFYTQNGEEKVYIDNETVALYTAIKNTGAADNVTDASGPKVLDIIAAAGIDCSGFDLQKVTFIGNDEYDAVFAWGDLFGAPKYAFPNANRPGDPGDLGAAVTEAEKEGAVEVPVILNLNATKDAPQLSFGQVSPSERNKPSWASKMMGKDKVTASILIEDVASFDQLPNVTDENVTVPKGSKVAVGDVIGFGGEEKSSPYNGTVYYTTDGSDPDQFSAIYNWDTYKKDGFQYNPFTVEKKGDIVIKTVEYKYGFETSEIKSFNYTTRTDLAKEGGKMTLSKTKVVAGKKPTVKVAIGGKTLKASTDYAVSIGSTKKVGTVTAKVTGKGDYKGTLSKSFKVIPAKAKFKSVTPGSKKATIVIASQKASGVTKYQIAYKLSSAKKWKTTTTTSTKKVIKKLKKNKKYNFKVRAYGKTGYGAYSTVKTVRIK